MKAMSGKKWLAILLAGCFLSEAASAVSDSEMQAAVEKFADCAFRSSVSLISPSALAEDIAVASIARCSSEEADYARLMQVWMVGKTSGSARAERLAAERVEINRAKFRENIKGQIIGMVLESRAEAAQ